MQKLIVLILCAIFFSCRSGEKTTAINDNMMSITGEILQTRDYCGGAAPSDELIEELRTPSPLAGLTLSFKKGSVNTMDVEISHQVTTDENGKFSIRIPSGVYTVLLPSQTDLKIFEPGPLVRITDQEKLREWWVNGFYSVDPQRTMVRQTIHAACDVPIGVPYVSYTGLPRP